MHLGTRVVLAAVGLLAGVAMGVGVVAAPASAEPDDQAATTSTAVDATVPPVEDVDHVVEVLEPVLHEPPVEDLDYVIEVEEPALSVPQVDGPQVEEPAAHAGSVSASEQTASMNEAVPAPEVTTVVVKADEPAEAARVATPSVLPATGAPEYLVPAVAGVLLILGGLVLVRRVLADRA